MIEISILKLIFYVLLYYLTGWYVCWKKDFWERYSTFEKRINVFLTILFSPFCLLICIIEDLFKQHK